MSTSIKFPGRNTITLCGAAMMQIIENAMNERAYDTKESPVRVTNIAARTDGGSPVFDVEITTDREREPTA